MSTRVVLAIDELHQLCDELTVIWFALGNSNDLPDDGGLLPIREHIHGIGARLRAATSSLDGGKQS